MASQPYYNTRMYFLATVIPAFEEFSMGLGSGALSLGGDVRRLGSAAQALHTRATSDSLSYLG